LFQWGRKADGHELIDWKGEVPVISEDGEKKADIPVHALFIKQGDWRDSEGNTLWESETSENNVCPVGYRLPTGAAGGEWEVEVNSWNTESTQNHENTTQAHAYESILKLSKVGYRKYDDGTMDKTGSTYEYWSATAGTTKSYKMTIPDEGLPSTKEQTERGNGLSVRCIKDQTEG
jgi:uncharacterized protein (TIGR02145 family)